MKVKQILNSEDCDAFSGINILFALCAGYRKQYFARKFLINVCFLKLYVTILMLLISMISEI